MNQIFSSMKSQKMSGEKMHWIKLGKKKISKTTGKI